MTKNSGVNMSQKRVKSMLMWLGIIAPVVGSYVATNSTVAVWGSEQIDHAVVWVCGLISILAAVNNPTRKGGL